MTLHFALACQPHCRISCILWHQCLIAAHAASHKKAGAIRDPQLADRNQENHQPHERWTTTLCPCMRARPVQKGCLAAGNVSKQPACSTVTHAPCVVQTTAAYQVHIVGCVMSVTCSSVGSISGRAISIHFMTFLVLTQAD